MSYEATNPCLRGAFKHLVELQLGAQTSVRAVIDITRHDQEIYTLLDRQVDDIIKCSKSCVSKHIGDLVIFCIDAFKRAIQVKISRMNELEQYTIPVIDANRATEADDWIIPIVDPELRVSDYTCSIRQRSTARSRS